MYDENVRLNNKRKRICSWYYDGTMKKSHNYDICWLNKFLNQYTVKPAFSGHSKIDKTKFLKTNGSLMQVESIAKCSLGALCNILDLH